MEIPTPYCIDETNPIARSGECDIVIRKSSKLLIMYYYTDVNIKNISIPVISLPEIFFLCLQETIIQCDYRHKGFRIRQGSGDRDMISSKDSVPNPSLKKEREL